MGRGERGLLAIQGAGASPGVKIIRVGAVNNTDTEGIIVQRTAWWCLPGLSPLYHLHNEWCWGLCWTGQWRRCGFCPIVQWLEKNMAGGCPRVSVMPGSLSRLCTITTQTSFTTDATKLAIIKHLQWTICEDIICMTDCLFLCYKNWF